MDSVLTPIFAQSGTNLFGEILEQQRRATTIVIGEPIQRRDTPPPPPVDDGVTIARAPTVKIGPRRRTRHGTAGPTGRTTTTTTTSTRCPLAGEFAKRDRMRRRRRWCTRESHVYFIPRRCTSNECQMPSSYRPSSQCEFRIFKLLSITTT